MNILLTGGTGFLGRVVAQQLDAAGHTVNSLSGRTAWDLTVDPLPPHLLIAADRIVHLAYPGSTGIGTALSGMSTLVDQQVRIDLNVVRAAALAQVPIVCVGSVCAYPESVPFPTTETSFWNGRPEILNDPYGQAKRLLLSLLDLYRREHGLLSTYLVLGNLYGPGDRSGHVVAANIRRCVEAARESADTIEVWGSPTTSRDFLYVEDAAQAIVQAVQRVPISGPINICSGEETSMASLLIHILTLTHCYADVWWDTTKPIGQPRRWFTAQRAWHYLQWKAATPLITGLTKTVDWYTKERA